MNPAEGRAALGGYGPGHKKALTEPQPFSLGRALLPVPHRRCLAAPVQQPLPPMVVATRSDDMLQYAAEHRLGLAVSFVPVDQMARVAEEVLRVV